MFEKVQLEMVNRGIGKTALFASERYKAREGQLIPVGSYIIKSAVLGDECGIAYVRTPTDPKAEYADADSQFTKYLMLEEGDELYSPIALTLTIIVLAAIFK